MPFKIGDKVKCINTNGSRNILVKGKIYTVFKISNYDKIQIERGAGFWLQSRFEIVTETTQQTDNTCKCSTQQLLQNGCVCGAITKYQTNWS